MLLLQSIGYRRFGTNFMAGPAGVTGEFAGAGAQGYRGTGRLQRLSIFLPGFS